MKVDINDGIYKKLSKRARETGFNDISRYLNYILEQVISHIDDIDDVDEEKMQRSKDMLRKVGYIE
jgi:hypothetical protein